MHILGNKMAMAQRSLKHRSEKKGYVEFYSQQRDSAYLPYPHRKAAKKLCGSC